jgi:threonylcarbamoyladenosine tRNA methylthiotransferase MtaB
MRVYFDVLGCKLNQAEAERWAREFAAAGFHVVNAPDQADLCVVHSCTVTNTASRKSRQAASQARRRGQITVLTGCYAEVVRQRGEMLPGVDLVVGTADTPRLLEVLRDRLEIGDWKAPDVGPLERSNIPTVQLPTSNLQPLTSSLGRTRAFVKVEDGCNMHCAFCIVPFTRGVERSRPLFDVVAEVQSLVEAGYQEVVVTGVQITSYRHNGHRLRDLVTALLAETDVPRLRLTSIAPWELDAELLELWHDPRLCRHLHLSLQSGCDTTLHRMRRPYSAEKFAAGVDLARQLVPGVGITTDVIVGFPGETEAEFAASLAFVERMGFGRVHVFPYSPRPGTAGAILPGQVPGPVKKERAAAMQATGEAGARRFARQFIGQTLNVLWETQADGVWEGYTDNYIRVRMRTNPAIDRRGRNLRNLILPVEVVKLANEGVWGRLV